MKGTWLRGLLISSALGGYVLAGAILGGLAFSDRGGLGRLLWEVGGVGVIAMLWFFLGMLLTISLIGTGTITRGQSYGPGHRQRVAPPVQPCRAAVRTVPR